MIWKIKCVHKFHSDMSHLEAEVFGEFVDCLRQNLNNGALIHEIFTVTG